MTTRTTPTASDVAHRFLDAVAARDFPTLRALFASDVWMRALLPREVVETRTADDAVETFREWFAPHNSVTAVATDQHTMEGREYFSYRFRLKPDWAPDQWHVVEQSGYCRVADEQITRVDLVCTGFFVVESASDAGAEDDG
jgi:hypothetical protein